LEEELIVLLTAVVLILIFILSEKLIMEIMEYRRVKKELKDVERKADRLSELLSKEIGVLSDEEYSELMGLLDFFHKKALEWNDKNLVVLIEKFKKLCEADREFYKRLQ